MGKVLCFIYENMADFETTFACNVLNLNGFTVTGVSFDKERIKARSGLFYYPECTIKEALAMNDIDALLITGGMSEIYTEELFELIRKLDKENKLIAAICAGPKYLAKAGILNNRKYTTTITPERFKDNPDQDPFPRENYIMQNVIRDGNIITAVGAAFVDFTVEIADWLKLFENEEEKEAFTKEHKGL